MSAKLAICTGGGDCAGINAAVVSAAQYAAAHYGAEVFFIEGGYEGLCGPQPRVLPAGDLDLTRLFYEGGTFLGTVNHGSPFKDAQRRQAVLAEMLAALKKFGISRIVTVGGEGTHGMSQVLAEAGVQIVGVVKTIDNDMPACDRTIGFSTAVTNTVEVLEKIRTTAQSLGRVFIVETMGRNSGFLALNSGLAAQCELIIVPEIKYDLGQIGRRLRQVLTAQTGRHHAGSSPYPSALVLVSEGAQAVDGELKHQTNPSGKKVLGGVAPQIARELHQQFGIETRDFSVSYLSRGGKPNAEDRLLAISWAHAAVDHLYDPKGSHNGKSGVICYRNRRFEFEPFSAIPAGVQRRLDLHDPMLQWAIKKGVCLDSGSYS